MSLHYIPPSQKDRRDFRINKERMMALNQKEMNVLVSKGHLIPIIQGLQKILRYEENQDVRELLNYLLLYVDSKPNESADLKWEEAVHGHRYDFNSS